MRLSLPCLAPIANPWGHAKVLSPPPGPTAGCQLRPVLWCLLGGGEPHAHHRVHGGELTAAWSAWGAWSHGSWAWAGQGRQLGKAGGRMEPGRRARAKREDGTACGGRHGWHVRLARPSPVSLGHTCTLGLKRSCLLCYGYCRHLRRAVISTMLLRMTPPASCSGGEHRPAGFPASMPSNSHAPPLPSNSGGGLPTASCRWGARLCAPPRAPRAACSASPWPCPGEAPPMKPHPPLLPHTPLQAPGQEHCARHCAGRKLSALQPGDPPGPQEQGERALAARPALSLGRCARRSPEPRPSALGLLSGTLAPLCTLAPAPLSPELLCMEEAPPPGPYLPPAHSARPSQPAHLPLSSVGRTFFWARAAGTPRWRMWGWPCWPTTRTARSPRGSPAPSLGQVSQAPGRAGRALRARLRVRRQSANARCLPPDSLPPSSCRSPRGHARGQGHRES